MKRFFALLFALLLFVSGCSPYSSDQDRILQTEVEKASAVPEQTEIASETVEPSEGSQMTAAVTAPPTESPAPEPFVRPAGTHPPVPEPTPEPTPSPTEAPTPVPTPRATPKPVQDPSYYTVTPGMFTESEIYLVARFITCEARYAGDAGQRSVASVVLNRVFNSSGQFPDTVTGVLLQHNQFVPEAKLMSTTPTEHALESARYVFSEHGSTLPKLVLFYRADYLGRHWENYMDYYATIEGNCFFYGKYYF